MNRWRQFLLGVLLLFTGISAFAAEPGIPLKEASYNILFIASYNTSQYWTNKVMSGFRDHFQRGNRPVAVDVLELNIASRSGLVPRKRELELVRDQLRHSYDLVVTLDNPVADLFLGNRVAMPAGTPLLILGYDGATLRPVCDRPNTTMLSTPFSSLGSLELGLKLLPGTKKVVFLIGGTPDGANIVKRLSEGRIRFPGVDLEIISGYDYSTAEMFRRLSELPPEHTFVIFHHWISVKDKFWRRQIEIFEKVQKRYDGPVFASFGEIFDRGAVGGVVADPIHFGDEGAEIAERILTGTRPEQIVSHRCEGRTLVNYMQMKAFGIPSDRLPENVVLLNRPDSFWGRYHDEIVLGAFWVALLILSGMGWFYFYLRRLHRWKRVFEAMPIHSAVVGATGKIYFLHAKLPEEIGKIRTLKDLPSDLQEVFRKPVEKVLSDGQPFKLEYPYMGCRRRAEVTRLPDDIFGVETVLWTSADVDELFALSERFRLTLQSIGDGVIVTDVDGVISMINSSAASLTGFSPEEACGKKLDDILNLVSYIDGSRVPSPLTKALESGKVVELANHTDLIAKDGRRFHIADSASPIRDGENRITGGVLIFRDVTAEYENRDQLRLQSAILKNLGKIANFSYFRGNFQGATLVPVKKEFWPQRNGVPISADEWIAPEYRNDVLSAWKNFQSGRTDEFYTAYTAGDLKRFYELRAVRSKNPVTGTDEFFGLILDVTHIRENEQRHHNDLLLLTNIMDNLQGYIFVKNADDGFRYLMANRKFCEISGMRPEELIGKSDTEIFAHAPEAMKRYRKDDEALLASGGTLEVQEAVPFANGNRVVIRTVKNLLTRSDGTRLIIGLSIDVTQQNQLESEREKLLEDLKSYVEQEKLLNLVWERLMTKLDDQEVFTEILKTIVGFMGAYTSYIYRSDFEVGKDIAYAYFEADSASNPPPLEEYPQMPIDPEAIWFKQTMNHQIWEVTDTETEEARRIQGEWNKYMKWFKVRALCGIGLWLNGKYWGYIGFTFTKPHEPLTAQQKFLLISMAHIAEIFLERRRSQKDLDRSEYEKKLILDTMNVPIMLFNPDMELIRCNNAALQIAGRSEDEVYRIGCQRSFCGMECRSTDCPVVQVHEDGKEHVSELRVKGRDYQLRAYPIIIDGKLVYIMKTMIDVTEFNTIQKQLTSALEQAQAANKAKSYFLATMSHEIRTPLNAVIGFSELLKGGGLSAEEQMEYLDSINFAGNSLLRLINDVLDLSKLEAEQTALTPQSTDIAALLHEIEAIFQYKVQEKKLFYRLDCPARLPLLKVDSLRLRQILLNLIGNAVKFTDHGGVTLVIHFEPDGDLRQGTLSIQVHDTGIGITGEAQARIFEPFVQSDTVRDTHVYGGTGLGLAISRRLAERMNGKITLESKVGKGSCFTLTLENIELADGENGGSAVPLLPSADVGRSRVLLVDDVPMNLKVLQAMLHKIGIDGVEAASGAQAWDILQKDQNFKLVLTDLWMPDMGGAELVQKIHGNSATAHLPVIVVTADAQIPEEKAQMFQGVLLKPITQEALKKALKQHYEV